MIRLVATVTGERHLELGSASGYDTMDEIVVLGGGIAGLTAAIALNQLGKPPVVLEAAPSLKAIGAGLGLGANAIKAFEKLGIGEDVIRHGRGLRSFTICDQRGNPITETESAVLSRKFGTQTFALFAIHRAALYEILLSKLNRELIRTNQKAIEVAQGEDSVTVKFDDGTVQEARFLIAADGIHSIVRKKLLPDSIARYAGYTCWRAVIENPGLNPEVSSETWGPGRRFGIVPLAENQLYWFACTNAPQNDPRYGDFRVADLRRHFADFHDPIPAILEHTSDEELLWNDILDLKPIDRYAFRNILLIGDAAHATTPNLGQGACQAIEDAVILADEIGRHSEIPTAFRRFEARRVQRTHFVTNTSWRVGKIAQIKYPWLATLRNALFRLVPAGLNEKQFEKLYTVDF